MIDIGGTLYGTTGRGGPLGSCGDYDFCGTVFSVTPSGSLKVLHSFGSGTDGKDPDAAPTDVNGTLYGTTVFGGGTNSNCSII